MSMSVCLSARIGYLQNHTRDLYQVFVRVAYVRGSVLLRHVYDRPHRLSPERGFLPHWKCIIGRERGDVSAQCGRSMLSTIPCFHLYFKTIHVLVHCKSKSSKYFTRYGVTTGLRWVGIFRDDLITNWLLSLKLKEMWKSVSILKLYGRSVAATFWVTRTVPIYPVLYQSVCVLVLF